MKTLKKYDKPTQKKKKKQSHCVAYDVFAHQHYRKVLDYTKQMKHG